LRPCGVQAQDKDAKPADKPAEAPARPAPEEESSVTGHSIKIGAQTIPYKATAATILLKNEKDEPVALLYSTAYTRCDVKDPSTRPMAFVYNGGPGLGKSQDKDFWGVDQDVKSLAQFVNLPAFLEEARHFEQTGFLDALVKGSKLGGAEKAEVAKQLSRYTGLSEDGLIKADLRVNPPQFMKELQRSRGLTTGRLDARFSGYSYDLLGEFGEHDPQDTSITGPFTAAFNSYVRENLKFGQDKV
jgi:carboxypeptidase C (cathepsin A)